ncbi:MAG TPA: ABC transporter substrate-binding protein [Ochrobactrum intermedium]|uniref:ABC transporter substrate-binding protein n=1 Tax=Brucella intermedia TaxID=94625 RepID=A0A7V6TYN6_9HYPH|nr:ABC transporter substrate-binding protein [Brucella intermedia]HHV67035.1 ABC transporter substrate-binding protein [Brucella intermedia]
MEHKIKSAVAFAAFAVCAGVSPVQAEECGNVTIASMNWQSAELLASLDRYILEYGYGCDAQLVAGDTVPTFTSMVEKQQPDIISEGWVNLLPDTLQSGIDGGKLVVTGQALSDGAQNGWFIPRYIAEQHPDIKTIADALKHPELFPAPEDPSKGAVFNGPQGWGGTLVTTQLFKAYGGNEANFTLVDTGSAAGLDGSLVRAYERKEPWLGLYWTPTAILGKYDMVMLDFGVPHDAAEWKRCNTVATCEDPKPNAWPKDEVKTVVTAEFSRRTNAAVMEYLQKRSWDNATLNKLLAWMNENQATGDDGARYFLETNEELWSKWLSPEATEKVRQSL